ncbi:hypothetical protein D3C83_188350 [compost metagenome]
MYVVAGDRAIRTPVRLGIAGAQRVEIVDGLTAGDEIIVSDLQAYETLTEIRIR